MRALARALGCALLLLSGFAAAAHAADQGRVLGTVVAAAGAPLAGVKVIITSPDMATYRVEKTTDPRGQFSAIILDAQRQYTIHLEKQGYVTLEQPLKLKIEDTLRESYSLQPATGPAEPAALGQPSGEPLAIDRAEVDPGRLGGGATHRSTLITCAIRCPGASRT